LNKPPHAVVRSWTGIQAVCLQVVIKAWRLRRRSHPFTVDQHSPSFSSVALAAAVDLAAVLMAARKGRSPGQGDQGFLRRNFQKKQLSEIGSLSLR